MSVKPLDEDKMRETAEWLEACVDRRLSEAVKELQELAPELTVRDILCQFVYNAGRRARESCG